MKPSQIRVFDGLRITTDHVNHLQGAFYSGLEDFREIVGLGRAQVGLEVSPQDQGSVVIQPGFAFDFEKNRLPVETAQTVKLDFATPDETKFICLKHAQVEDGAVEGHPTMIWDSSTVVVRTAEPDAKENLVVLARVSKTADGALRVCPAERCWRGEAPAKHETPSTPGVPAPPAEAPAPPVPAPKAPGAEPPVPEPSAAPASEPAAPALPRPAFQLKQGVMQLASDPGTDLFLKTVLAPALRKKLGADPMELSFTLAQPDLVPGFAVAGFSTHCALTAELTMPGANSTPSARYRLRSAATGEATVTAGGLAQFGLSNMQASPVPAPSGALWAASDLTGRGLAHFAFGQWLEAPETARPPLAADILSALELLVALDPSPGGFRLVLKLLWSGKASEESTHELETRDLGFVWNVNFGWKAIGG